MALLDIRDASKSFGEVRALGGVSFHLDRGEILGLLGPNGSGKSTLMRSIVTLERLDQGSIAIEGVDAAGDPAGARGHLGYAGQDMAIDKVLTGREFLRFQAGLVHLPKEQIAARVDEMLQRLDLADAADRSCEGYSGGMRRRLDLAASLMHSPALLVLDEPSTGLDLDARRRLWDFLRGLRSDGTGLLLATHDFEEVDALCDRVVLMSHGRVVGTGTPAELRAGLGAWVLSASLHEHPEAGDFDRLRGLFAELPGRTLPPDPRRAELEFVVSGPSEQDSREWVARIQSAAQAEQIELFSVAMRKPTLQDAYRMAVGEPSESPAEA